MRKYTIRQITEAIAYWKKQLNESPVSDDEFNKCRETAEDIVANTVVSEAEQKQAILPFVAAEALIQYANFISRFAVKDKNSAEKRLAMNGAVKDFKRYAQNVLDIAYDLGFTSRGDVVEIRESDEENYDEVLLTIVDGMLDNKSRIRNKGDVTAAFIDACDYYAKQNGLDKANVMHNALNALPTIKKNAGIDARSSRILKMLDPSAILSQIDHHLY